MTNSTFDYKALYEDALLAQATATQYAEEVTKQNAELVAQVALLCEKLKDIEDTESDKPYVYRLQAKQALRLANDSPAQHLRDIQAEAGRAGFVEGYDSCWFQNYGTRAPEHASAYSADQYAEKVRSGKV